MDKKAECNLIATVGFITVFVGFFIDNSYLIGAGFGIVFTALHFRVDSLKER